MSINEILADPAAVVADPNGDGTASTSEDEFVELTNGTAMAVDISGYTLSDAVGIKHTFAANTVIPAGGALVVFSGGAPTGLFNGVTVVTASTGRLDLNNSDETLTLASPTGTVITTVTYGLEASHDASIVRVPEYFGAFVRHDRDLSSGGRAFSPGSLRNGIAF